ncbi:hypothetical protein B0H63DRAFT_528984 [Podospora didyma]|uniref:Copper acquisition factor BIM1-like domain-containing protein n=1 Tax=Podospora didyma TaxID=330526 RepID=A0AAE0N2S3_9PEZI|nr:hypothetical protein B0H63DRAFT_528984 [Podospora didyma]
MAPLRSLVAAALLLVSSVNAHFLLLHPTSLEGTEIDESKEGNAPCGANMPDLASSPSSEFHVGGDQVAVQLSHPQANWLIRGTLDGKASGNWTQMFPIVKQSGVGAFCEIAVVAPEAWVGKKGVISVAANAPDGILYQCAVVNFVSGTNTTLDSNCRNASSVTASPENDVQLAALISKADTTTKGNSASGFGLPLGSLFAAAAMAMAGAAIL